MSYGRTGNTGFRARAGLLTIMFLVSTLETDVLLRILEDANSEGGLSEDAEWLQYVEEAAEREAQFELEAEAQHEIEEEPTVPGLGEIEFGGFGEPPLADADQPMKTTPRGAEAAVLGFALERWLAGAPGGPQVLGDPDASAALLGLVFGWSSTVIHQLADPPLTLRELNLRIDGGDPGAIAEHVGWLVQGGLVEKHGEGGEARYAVTDWLRRGVAPLTLAARLERRQPETSKAPIDRLDVEAALLLALPLAERSTSLTPDLNGSCSLGVDLAEGGATAPAGVTVQVEGGRVTSCSPGISQSADALASAPTDDWLDTVVQPEAKRIQISGDQALACGLLEGSHRALYGW